MVVSIVMPGRGDEHIEPSSVFVVRETSNYEREENPAFVTCIWGGGYKVYAAESLADVATKFEAEVKFARLTAPNGQVVLVSMQRVVDRDEPLRDQDSKLTKSVLAFGVGATAPRTRVKESKEELIQIWTKAGVALDAFA